MRRTLALAVLIAGIIIMSPRGAAAQTGGAADMHDLIVSNVERLGFAVEDIRIMISSHAHWDHVEGHAAMKRATGAEVVALGGDAVALQSGRDNSAVGARDFEPVVVDRVIADGDTVMLGGVTLRALWTGGHTQGATMWMTTVEEGDDPDVFLHNHPQSPPRALDPTLLVDARCATCFDAAEWTAYVAGVEARFEDMLREAAAAVQ
jgi:hypothetical protein